MMAERLSNGDGEAWGGNDGTNANIGKKFITLEDGSSVELPEGVRDEQDYREYQEELRARENEANILKDQEEKRENAVKLASRIEDSVDEGIVRESIESGDYSRVLSALAEVGPIPNVGDQIRINQDSQKLDEARQKYGDIIPDAMEVLRGELSKDNDNAGGESVDEPSSMDKLEASIFERAGTEEEVKRGEKMYTREQAEKMIEAVRYRAPEGSEVAEEAVEEKPKAVEQDTETPEEDKNEADDSAEKESNRNKLLDRVIEIPTTWLRNNARDASWKDILSLSDEELADLVEQYEQKDGTPEEETAAVVEEELEETPEEEPTESPEAGKEAAAEIEKAEADVKKARAELAEMSAKRRGLFGRKHGGEQEKAYDEARKKYEEATAKVIRLKMDAHRKASWAMGSEVDPEEMEARKGEIEAAVEKSMGAKFVELWCKENSELIEETKDRIDNGNVIRKIGKLMDKCPRWAKIAAGIGISVGLGSIAPLAGLAGAVAISAGKAVLFTRSGSKNSAIEANKSIFNNSERIFTDEGRTSGAEQAERVFTDEERAAGAGKEGGSGLLTPEKIRELPKDQAESYSAVASWITNQHTGAILIDKYDNRRRTLIATGSAVALTVGAHFITGVINDLRAGGEGIAPAPPNGGGVNLGEAVTPPVEAIPTDFNLDYVAPSGSTIGQAFRSIFGIEQGSEAYNQALQMFEDVTGAVRGEPHVFKDTAIASSFNGLGKTALEDIAKAIANGTIKP